MNNRAEQVTVDLGVRTYTVSIAPNLFSGPEAPALSVLARFVHGRKTLLVADSRVASFGYPERILALLKDAGADVVLSHVIPSGEEHKTFLTAEEICRAAARGGLDRDSVILSAGGGVTCDLSGFAASIYMRGIHFISIPTTLLAMIDAGIGGKTGADLPEGKNLIGTFWQPKAVLMDVSFLASLPPEEMRCGCAELVKHAILFDPEFFRILQESVESLLSLANPEQTARMIARSCRLKAAVVSNDERESGHRALLNFGHSFGHAIEKLKQFRMSHGDAVSIGIAIACDLAVSIRLMHADTSAEIVALLAKCGLPVRVAGLLPADILNAMRGDKKNLHGKFRIVLPRALGRAEILSDIPEEQLLDAIGGRCD